MNDSGSRLENAGEPSSRGFASRPTREVDPRMPLSAAKDDSSLLRPATPPDRALAGSSPARQRTGFQRAMSAARIALPLVQRILPLLDGNIASAVYNVLAQPPTHPPAPPVNLEPIEDCLIDLQNLHRNLQNQVLEQNSTLRRIEDQLDTVRDAVARNAQAQNELHEELKAVNAKINIFAFFILCLLGVSALLSVVLYLQMRHILP